MGIVSGGTQSLAIFALIEFVTTYIAYVWVGGEFVDNDYVGKKFN